MLFARSALQHVEMAVPMQQLYAVNLPFMRKSEDQTEVRLCPCFGRGQAGQLLVAKPPIRSQEHGAPLRGR
jgi:hypothetical protein